MNALAVIDVIYFVVCMLVAVGSIFFALRSYLRVKPPRPSTPTEIPELREDVLRLLRSKGRFRDIDEEDRVKKMTNVEKLRFYARYADQHKLSSLDMIVSSLRYCRSKGVTKLKSDEFNDEHMAIYQRFDDFIKTRADDVPVSIMSIIEPTMYAVSHPDEVDMIHTIVCERRIYDYKLVKTMLKEMKANAATGSSSLAEGML